MYSDLVHEHFERPRNVGILQPADAEALVSNPARGDTMHLYLRILERRIVAATFQTMGYPAARHFYCLALVHRQDNGYDISLSIGLAESASHA